MFRTIRLRVAALSFAALLVAGSGVARAAAWLPPTPLNNSATSTPSVAVDAAGDALTTWNTPAPSAVQASHHLAGSPGFTQLPDLANDPSLSNTGAVVASNRHGDAIAAWVHDTGFAGDHTIEIASLTPTGALASPVVTAHTNGSDTNVAVAINSNGDAIVAWLHGASTIQAVTRQGLGGSFTDLTNPTDIDPLAVGQPSVAIDSPGNSIIVWQTTTGTIGAKRHPAGGSWPASGDTPLATGGHTYSEPDVAFNPIGLMVVAFQDSVGPSAVVVRGNVSTGWGATPVLGTLSSTSVSHGPQAALDDTGNAVIGWATSTGVQFSHFGSSGAFPSPASVQSITTELPNNFALSGSGRGDAIAAWSTNDPGLMQNVVRAVVKPSTSSTFGSPQIVSSTTTYSSNPVVALDELGDGVVPYQLGATPAGIAAAVYDASAPKLGTVSKPSSVQAGKTAAFSATATDAFSAVTLRWSFGDGSAASTGTSVTHKYTRSGRFTVTLTATDAANNASSATFTVTVTPAPPPPKPKCVVPKLKGKTLSQARGALSRAHCKLGKVHQPKKPKHRRLRKLIVKSSSPGRGAVRANGTKVAVTLVEVPKPKPKKHKK